MNRLSIKFQLFIMASLVLIAFSAAARQDGGPHGDRGGPHGPPDAEMRVAWMTEMLDLTDEQSAQLLVVMQDIDEQREVVHQKVMELMKPELCDLQLRTEADIAAILTPDQLAQLEEKKEKRAGKRGGRGFRGMDSLDCSEYE